MCFGGGHGRVESGGEEDAFVVRKDRALTERGAAVVGWRRSRQHDEGAEDSSREGWVVLQRLRRRVVNRTAQDVVDGDVKWRSLCAVKKQPTKWQTAAVCVCKKGDNLNEEEAIIAQRDESLTTMMIALRRPTTEK